MMIDSRNHQTTLGTSQTLEQPLLSRAGDQSILFGGNPERWHRDSGSRGGRIPSCRQATRQPSPAPSETASSRRRFNQLGQGRRVANEQTIDPVARRMIEGSHTTQAVSRDDMERLGKPTFQKALTGIDQSLRISQASSPCRATISRWIDSYHGSRCTRPEGKRLWPDRFRSTRCPRVLENRPAKQLLDGKIA